MKASGHRVLITGGGSGIGLALAERMLSTGNEVILVGRDVERLRAAANRHERARIFAGDLGDPALPARLVREFPDVNVLINNAGIQYNFEFAAEPKDELARKIAAELQVNFTAPLMLARAFLPALIRRAGAGEEAAIINVTSGLALVPKATAPVYCPTKAALRSFSRILRWQLEESNVLVMEVLPPLVDTAMTAGRGRGKLTPAELADEFWPAFLKNRPEVYIGKSKLLKLIDRLSPSLAENIMKKS